MKLTPENIAKLEEVLTDHQEGMGNRGIIIKYGFRDLPTFSQFLTCLRHLGIDLEKRNRVKGTTILSPMEAEQFREWLREKRAERDNDARVS